MTCCASTFQVARDASRRASIQWRWAAPRRGVARVHGGAVERAGDVAVGLVRAVLARVQDQELGEASERRGPVQVHVRASRQGAGAERHGLVVGLVGGRAPHQELHGVLVLLLGDGRRVVVVELMVVPRDEPRALPVHRLQPRVGPVQGVAFPVFVQRPQASLGRAGVAAHLLVRSRPLVDVVAQVHHEVGPIPPHGVVRGEQPVLEVLARGKGKPQLARHRVWRGQRARPALGALRAVHQEPVPILPARLQPANLDVDGMPELGRGPRHPAPDASCHGLVLGQFPAHLHGLGPDAVAGLAGVGSQPGPEDDAGGVGVAGGHALLERVAAPARPAPDRRGALQAERGQRGEGGGGGEEQATGEPSLVPEGPGDPA